MENLIIENARLIFRNFSGKEGKYNRQGDRSFCVLIDDPAMAERLREDGWNVRILAPREGEDKPAHYIPVAVSYKFRQPKIFMISGKVKTPLNQESVGVLDFADIRTSDIVLRPYEWEVNGKTGVKAYLDTMYVTIIEDAFASKYSSLEDSEELEPGDLPL